MPQWRDRVSMAPDVMMGKPVITGTRIPVEMILRKLSAGLSVEAILRDYPSLTQEDIRAALAYAADAGDYQAPATAH